jgi:hypothetical protein
VTRRLVAKGRKRPPYATQTWQYVLEDPLWRPQAPNEPAPVDGDLRRKIALESRDPEDLR